MLCEDGRCKTCSSTANGYVRGEGVGMLVLKKLTEAEQDGDHIYGVIRGSAENHGGRAASLTAPNPRAQADLLITAYRKAGIDPRTVGYIEAHGTGTALGDPIEINGLKIAFSKLTETGARHSPYGEGAISQAWCGIGSVKSNIGHLELAAGVAGVIKALLQLQHKTLVKSLHCEQINPYIQLEGSPFYIVRENQEWEALRDSAGNTLPRRAGVSSFGFGGANAHVVLEEYLPQPGATLPRGLTKQPPSEQALPRLIVLSAKNEERLHEQVRQLLVWVQAETQLYRDPPVHTPTASDQRLLDLAYTLQVGREAMEERLALQVSSLAELEEKLRRYLQEPQEEAGDWYRGQVKQYKETVALFGDKEEIQEFVERWFKQGKHQKLLQWWVKGGNVDWRLLSPVGVSQKGQGTGSSSCPLPIPRRISLPTYPFARERYWLSAPSVEPISGSRAAVTSPRSSHPIALRPLADGPVPSHGEMNDHQRGDQGQATVPLSRQAGPTGAKHLHLSIT